MTRPPLLFGQAEEQELQRTDAPHELPDRGQTSGFRCYIRGQLAMHDR